MAGIPEFALRQIERWCARRVPGHLRDQVRVECRTRGRAVTIFELRDGTEREIAQLRVDEFGIWSVFWADSDGEWLAHPDAPVASTPPPLLAEIERRCERD
ncbi:DUF3024 domain-containing protein [Amycolatopsis sp. SID8362]|uniref:DUF3024 domain-containing protein n=1 Tax=Amycolatopsis sp. SID8362 TaxID=2690346 RepID=UPI001370D4E1|nr:DUF3024 domain-containing protein [Amycolatopsis sp. SID8362]NBH07991.1 DUF3024 domain-containing protein [Amycolatopsis sp. SID8362]NED44685.1 DUF3024 domain-containing protein [Amycolatopsis sp. SID8362]